ncbi:phage tail fiber domain-containing protein [Serratia fonticola]
MAIPNQTPYNIFTANGISTVFPYEFYLLNTFDLTVSINGAELTSGFTISGIGNVDGGEVTFLTPPANGSVILLERVVPTYRLTEYQDNGDLLAETVNKDFDRLWMAIQQAFIYLGLVLTRPLLGGPFNAHGYRIENLGDPVNPQDAVTKSWFLAQNNSSLAKTLRVPEPSVNQLPTVAGRNGRLLAFNNVGQPIAIHAETDDGTQLEIDLAGADGFKYIGRCSDVAALRELEPTNAGQIINIVSYHAGWSAVTGAPTGGGEVYYDAMDTTSSDDGVLVFVTVGGARWKRITDDVTFEMAGAVGDGVTSDDTVYLQRAFDLMLATGKTIRAGNSDARYLFSSQLTIYAGAGKLVMDRARLVVDHTKMLSGAAVRVMGNPSEVYNLGSELEIRLQGPYGGDDVSRPPIAPVGTLDGIAIYPGNNTQVSTVLFKVWVEGFRRNIYIGNKSVYLLQFEQIQCGKFWDTGCYMDCSADAGENISFFGGVFYNGLNSAGNAAAIRVPGTGQYLNAHFYGVSFDYSDLVFDIATGILTFHGGQFENNSANPYGLLTYTSGRRKPQVFMTDLVIDGGNDSAQTYANQGDATGKRVWFKTIGPCIFVAKGGAWGKFGKMQNSSILESTGTGALSSVSEVFFDIQSNVDYVRMGGYNTPLRNANFATQDTTGWKVEYSYPSEPSAVKPTVTYDGSRENLGPALKISSPSSGGDTTTTIRQRMTVRPGQMLYLGTRLLWSAISAPNGSAYFEFAFFDYLGAELGRGQVGISLSTQPPTQTTPVVCSRSLIIPPGAVQASVGFRHYQCSGDIWMGSIFAFAS